MGQTIDGNDFANTDDRTAQARRVGRTIEQVDVLVRALGRWRHWSATAFARSAHRGASMALDRLHAQAAEARDAAQAETLIAAYRLFEADQLHAAYLDICQDAGIAPDAMVSPAPARTGAGRAAA